ncbi:MAG: GNAT family N-acetyltransferase [Tetrasphaera sp.]
MTPSLLAAARSAGLDVAECPLLVLEEPALLEPPAGYAIEILPRDSHHLGEVGAAVHAGFAGTDEVGEARDGSGVAGRIEAGLTTLGGAIEIKDHGLGAAAGGGSHNPRGTTTELVGIAVIPRARRIGLGAAIASALVADAERLGIDTVFLSAQDEAVARVYERVGFRRVGTACIAG